jgi:DNA invertase Pin-like site-specific DNA recombinase
MILDGYVRVSQVRGRSGESFISPAVQQEQIEAWAASRGARIALVHIELDESGARADRPKLLQALERVETGTVDGIAVAKLDRFGRSLLDGLTNIQRIQDAGGTFVSIQDGLDLSTDTGKLVLRILLSMAEWELDRIRRQWQIANERAIARGVHLGATPPTGYRRDKTGHLAPDPTVAPLITEFFQRRANGASIAQLAQFLRTNKVRSSRGGIGWPASSVAVLIRNRTYLGEVHKGDLVLSGAHQPLTDAPTWHAAQHAVNRGPMWASATPTLAGGLVRCAGCGLVAHSGTTNQDGAHPFRAYRSPRHSSAGRCAAPAYARGWEMEHLLEQAFFALVRQQPRPPSPHVKLQRDLNHAEQALADYRDHPTLLRTLGATRFEAGIRARLDRVDGCATAVAADRARVMARGAERRTAEQWIAAWPTMTITERREAISTVIECAFIERGGEPLAQRLWICPRGQGPAELPARGCRPKTIRSFTRGDAPATVSPQPEPPWPLGRIREELAAYVAGVGRWPGEQEFLDAGYGPLLRQVDETGGQDAWARRVGVAYRRSTTRDDYWIDERLRATIVEVMRTRTEWPHHSEWLTIAPDGPGREIRPNNRRWAREFGFEPRRRRRYRRWTPETIAETVLQVAAGSGRYPTQQQFGQAGLSGLGATIALREGHAACAARVGLAPSSRTASHWRTEASLQC